MGFVLARIMIGIGLILLVLTILSVLQGLSTSFYDVGVLPPLILLSSAFSSFVGGALLGVLCEISSTLYGTGDAEN